MALLSAGKVGFVLALSGVAHFAAPDKFIEITKNAFPDDPEAAIKRNGASETVLGLGLMLPKTRTLAKLGLLGYVGWLGFNGAQVAKAAQAAQAA
jgi:uncharacterized membrane protein